MWIHACHSVRVLNSFFLILSRFFFLLFFSFVSFASLSLSRLFLSVPFFFSFIVYSFSYHFLPLPLPFLFNYLPSAGVNCTTLYFGIVDSLTQTRLQWCNLNKGGLFVFTASACHEMTVTMNKKNTKENKFSGYNKKNLTIQIFSIFQR